MARTFVVLLLGLTACERLIGIHDLTLADGAHALIDAREQFPDGPTCFTGGLVTSCIEPPAPITIFGTINTSTDGRCVVVTQAGGPELCIIAGASVTVSGITHVIGSRALVLASATTLEVDATLDASSVTAGQIGAAATAIACPSGSGSLGGFGGGGGAGGSFGSVGGDGGTGTNGNQGTANTKIVPTIVRGGCAGGAGGGGPLGGVPGGAVYLEAGATIVIATGGAVFASGTGGQGGPGQIGAGGGASGGMVGLDAPMIRVDGIVAANGGGGGKGGDSNSGTQAGGSGADGTTTQYATPASGGTISAPGGGRGGNGAAAAIAAQRGTDTVANGAAGGGGGGGVGVVWVRGAVIGTQISPSPLLH